MNQDSKHFQISKKEPWFSLLKMKNFEPTI